MSDLDKAMKIADGIWWVGFGDDVAGFSNNPYLIVDGDDVILIDPGSRRPQDYNIVKKKVESIIPIKKINYIIVHHQDPDLCASIPLFEEIIGINNYTLIATYRTSLLIPYYDIKTEVTPIDDGDILTLQSGRELKFITSPYLHFPGAHVTYDSKTKALFSSDIFGGFTANWKLYADENYIESMRIFLEPYVGHKSHVENFAKKIANLPIDLICPQHGSIIQKKDIPKMLEAVMSFNFGTYAI